jgi:hypothetical protein
LSGEAGRLVTLITAADCHLCEHARRVLSTLGEKTHLIVSEVSWESDEGHMLVSRDGVAFPPAVYVNGILAGYGRISERALRRQLAEPSL